MFPLLDNLDSIFTLSNLVCTLEVWFHATSCVYWYSPLTTLRDKLVVALQDAEGNEISNTGLE
uniref:Uncharacterized protein n=1 Tax=Rhizophora mucronata TaxID=61149 RepID=A0A2P2LWY5_RHIMU